MKSRLGLVLLDSSFTEAHTRRATKKTGRPNRLAETKTLSEKNEINKEQEQHKM
jgi:hypothetical protein